MTLFFRRSSIAAATWRRAHERFFLLHAAKVPRVVSEGGGLQARANLNGGELDKEPFLRDKM